MNFKIILVVVALFQASLAFPYADGEKVANKGNVPDKTDSTKQTERTGGWISKGVDMLTGMIKGQADIVKGVVGMVGSGTHMGAQLTTAAGELGTGISNAAFQGGLKIGEMGIEAGTNLAHQGLEIVNQYGDMLPRPLKESVHKWTGIGKSSIDQAEGLSKDILAQVGNNVSKGLTWFGKTIKNISNTVDTTLNKGTSSLQDNIDKGSDKLTGSIHSTLGKLKNIVDKIRENPVVQ